MHNLLRYYRRNRKKIIVVILGVAFIILLVQVLNSFVEKGGLKNTETIVINSSTNSTTINNKIKESAVIGENLQEKSAEKITAVIKNFFKYCNEGDIDAAYNLLSKECKEIMYPTLEDFKKNYYSCIFTEEKIYDLQNWISNSNYYTYKVDIMSDILATGNKNENKKTDYYTILKNEDNEYVININSYIGRIQIDKETTMDNINIKVNYKDIYMNCENYNFSIRNNSQNTILLSSNKSEKSIYLEDSSEVKYVSYLYEVPDKLLVIEHRKRYDYKY